VPHPQWVKVVDVTVPDAHLERAAALLREQLGEDGIRRVGGRQWWQWRKPGGGLKAEWIEMRADYNERKRNEDAGRRVIYYVHGGAYYFGSIEEHRYQLQRHARKLKGRVFTPEYRLAPQFPFPCGLQDCLAGYLYLLTVQDPSTIVLAGDSAGAGMLVSMMVTLRDRGLPLPAGAVLISPWVDLTHSFPSVAGHQPMDFIPAAGFHHKPSRAWPPPNEDEMAGLRREAEKLKGKEKRPVEDSAAVPSEGAPLDKTTSGDSGEESDGISNGHLRIEINGEAVLVKDQIQVSTFLRRKARR
jgi:acetyl esterase/lipase